MAALVLSACGAGEEEIVVDYHRSDGVDAMALGGLEKQQDMQVGVGRCGWVARGGVVRA